MNRTVTSFQADSMLQGKELRSWRALQIVFGITGLGIFLALILFPKIGIQAFWNVLIPVAPALFVLAAGFWRNVCPLGSFSLLPRHLGLSRGKRLSLKWQGRLQLAGVGLLFLIVPVRHLVLDTNGYATALTLGFVAALAFTAGCFFEWKSGWCSGLCPVHPVEKMYGAKVLYTPPNAHCRQCQNCCIPCPDSTPSMNPLQTQRKEAHQLASTLLVGGLPGFIWGWFHVSDCKAETSWQDCLGAFGKPWLGLLVSLALFLLLRRFFSKKPEAQLAGIFAAAAVSCYYWFRIPALVGYGLFPEDGMLMDLTNEIPRWAITCAQIAIVAFFGWWLILKKSEPAVWAVRPPFATGKKQVSLKARS